MKRGCVAAGVFIPSFAFAQNPTYAPPAPPPPTSLHNGMTVELNMGLGWVRVSDSARSDTTVSLAGIDIGVGGWLRPHLAITGRLAGVHHSENGGRFTDAFLGPSAQYWLDDQFWFGGGAGFAFVIDTGEGVTGFGLDLRAGYTFTTSSENTFNASLELMPGFYADEAGDPATFVGFALLLGYQHL